MPSNLDTSVNTTDKHIKSKITGATILNPDYVPQATNSSKNKKVAKKLNKSTNVKPSKASLNTTDKHIKSEITGSTILNPNYIPPVTDSKVGKAEKIEDQIDGAVINDQKNTELNAKLDQKTVNTTDKHIKSEITGATILNPNYIAPEQDKVLLEGNEVDRTHEVGQEVSVEANTDFILSSNLPEIVKDCRLDGGILLPQREFIIDEIPEPIRLDFRTVEVFLGEEIESMNEVKVSIVPQNNKKDFTLELEDLLDPTDIVSSYSQETMILNHSDAGLCQEVEGVICSDVHVRKQLAELGDSQTVESILVYDSEYLYSVIQIVKSDGQEKVYCVR